MCNLVNLQGEIKAILNECTGTPTAKLIALLNAAGFSKAGDLAQLIGISDRAIRKAKAELQFRNYSSGGTTVPELQDRAELQDRNHSSESGTTVPDSALARVLDNHKLTSLEDRPKKNITPKSPKLGKAEALEAFNAYNAIAERLALPQASKLTPERERFIIARLKAYGLDGWTHALANIEKSPFLMGETDHQFRPTLDFVCQAKSFGKLHDGGYGTNRKIAVTADSPNVVVFEPEWYKQAQREMAAMGWGQ